MGSASNGSCWVYEFYAADGTCLYVGFTEDFSLRLRWHRRVQPWFGQVARLEVNAHPDYASGTAAEAARIRTLNPLHNRALTDHDTPRTTPCRTCRQGAHRECIGINRDGDACPCGVCATARAAA